MFTSHLLRLRFSAILVVGLFASLTLTNAAQAQTPTTVYAFPGGSGQPVSPSGTTIALGRDGNLYATSQYGGAGSSGKMFKVTPSGTLSVVYDPNSYLFGVTLGTDGSFYGANYNGGANGFGTVYKVTSAGTATLLNTFLFSSGPANPYAPPIEAANGVFYGTTSENEERDGYIPQSVAYTVTSAGVFTVIHTFTGTDGQNIYAGLVQGTDGNFYGCSAAGGANSDGVIFKMSASGTVTVLHNFAGTDGSGCSYALIQASDGNFYGVAGGGSASKGVIFKISSTGIYTVIHNLNGTTDGNNPTSPLVQATDGNLYGVTASQATFDAGTVYRVTTGGTLTTLYSFTAGTDGGYPQSALRQHTNGLLYGSTFTGGDVSTCSTVIYAGELVVVGGCGVIYSLDIKANPFVSLVSTSGKVGSKIGILGQGFSSASVVKFNGVTVSSLTRSGSTYISAAVPVGATDGKVTVTTGSTKLTSDKTFIVHDSWSTGAAMPTAVYGAVAGELDNKIYVVGGYSTATVADNQIYNPATNTWSTGVALPTPTDTAASAVIDNILYVIGGSSSLTGTFSNAVWAYNPSTKTWSAKAAMPTARNGARAVVEGGIIYVMGGYNGTTFIDTVESYNPATNTWKEEAPMLGTKDVPAAGVLGSTVVVAGGANVPGSVTGDTEGYNSKTNTWTTLTADPTARTGPCSGVINGVLYDAAGYINNGGAATTVNEAFALSADKWTTTLAPMPQGTMFGGSVVVSGQLYCFGGEASINGSPVSSVQIYQP